MIHIIKNCPKHGALTITQVTTSGRSKSGAIFRCKECLKISHKKFYEKNKEKVKKKQQEYKEKDPVKYKEGKNRSNKKYAHKYKEKEKQRNKKWRCSNVEHLRKLKEKRTISYIENLPDTYIRDILTRRSPLSAKDIPDSIVEIKRVSMLIKRIRREELRHGALNKPTEENRNVEGQHKN